MSNLIERFKGDTYSVEAVLTKEGVPVDFSAGNNTATFSYSKGSVSNSIPGVNGTVDGEISFPFPADVKAGTYKYDIQVTSSAGEVRTYVKNKLIIADDITK